MFSQVAERPLGEEFTRPSSPEYPRPSHLLWHQQRQQQHVVDEEEEDEEPVHALDLRICKAAESITIFDEENVLALTASSAGPDRNRQKHLPDRFCPYSPSNAPSTSRHNNTEERVLQNNNNNSHKPSDQDRLIKEKDDWLRNFRQFQPSSSNSNSNDVTNSSEVSSGRQSVSTTWNQEQQRMNDVLGSSRSFSASQHHQEPDCNLPQCHVERDAYPTAINGGMAHPRSHHPSSSSHHNTDQVSTRAWSVMKEEPMSPLPLSHSMDYRSRYLESGHHHPNYYNQQHQAPNPNQFDRSYYLPPFPGHDQLMKAKQFFGQPHPSQQLLMAAAAQHRQQQQKLQQQQYKMNTESLQKKLISMQHENEYKSNPYPNNSYFDQHPVLGGPPPLLPFENGSQMIKEEPNISSTHTRHSSAEDRSRTPTLIPWPPKRHSHNNVESEIKEEQIDKDEPREKFNPDKLRSTFLWHVLQRHSAKRAPNPDDSTFLDIDDRLKSIEQASGMYNQAADKMAHRTPDHLPMPQSESKSQYYPHDPSPDFNRHHHDHQHPNHLPLLNKIKEEETSSHHNGFDLKLGGPRFFREKLHVHSPISSMGDLGEAASPYSAASPFTGDANGNGRRGRPRKHAPKVPLPPIYVFIRNLLHNRYYNPRVVSWVNESYGIFRVNNTNDFARTWGLMKTNRGVKMNYEKLSRAMRYHYGSIKQGRKGHLAMVKEKRLFYRFGELAINWRPDEVNVKRCERHELCKQSLCLWTKE